MGWYQEDKSSAPYCYGLQYAFSAVATLLDIDHSGASLMRRDKCSKILEASNATRGPAYRFGEALRSGGLI
jgi:hypothetical protein